MTTISSLAKADAERVKGRAEALGYGFSEKDGTITLYSEHLVVFVGTPQAVDAICHDKERFQRPVGQPDKASGS